MLLSKVFGHKHHLYMELVNSKKLNGYLVDVNRQAVDLFFQLVKDLAKKENVTEKLKTENLMLWVQKMNNIRNHTTEVANEELIYN